ncbi:UDP-N-acetylmuramoyl-L-alanyl-D-glutamate--2,6-diaminopimelate ligase [Peribacillus sp. SCS-155]|uniref:UDP-N-acetylmuramoyl-L-alanyl-D-glutamate--2, 6-diaminopimelate ligase n=1 Tax=Peribacillus sedimenti TaxID=3115297 RepID=UPI0039057777
MKLSQLVQSISENVLHYQDDQDIEISGLEMNSRKVGPGTVFVAIPGFTHDGHEYIEDAIKNGAAAIIGEIPQTLSVPYIQVADSRKALARAASAFYGFPSRKHKLIGITGTNGKTTVSYMLKHILNTAGRTCSLFGTVTYSINDESYKPANTTPDSLQLQRLLAKSNDEFVVMEVSSHALHQSRVEAIEYDFAIFTNLSHDHLDYHQTMEEYFKVKAGLFLNHLNSDGKAILNHFNEWGIRLSRLLGATQTAAVTLGRTGSNPYTIREWSPFGGTFTLMEKNEAHTIEIGMPGIHNVYNAAMAFMAAREIGIPADVIISALKSFEGVPGRFEVFPHPSGARFIVDYAHTTDAVEYCLRTARSFGAKQVSHIYGFRGDRDVSKRAHMVKTSASYSDRFILTFDDLNGVDPKHMVEELEQLTEGWGNGKGLVISDRTLAIIKAWEEADEGHWVFITGKGPEAYKEEFLLPFQSDRDLIDFLRSEEVIGAAYSLPETMMP